MNEKQNFDLQVQGLLRKRWTKMKTPPANEEDPKKKGDAPKLKMTLKMNLRNKEDLKKEEYPKMKTIVYVYNTLCQFVSQ